MVVGAERGVRESVSVVYVVNDISGLNYGDFTIQQA